MVEPIKSFDNVKKYILNHKSIFLFFIYVILVSGLFMNNPLDIISNNVNMSIIMALFGAFIILIMYFDAIQSLKSTKATNLYQSTFVIIANLFIMVGIICSMFYFFKYTPMLIDIVIYLLDFIILIGILSLVYKYLSKNNEYLPLINTVFYIPLQFINLIQFVKNEWNITTNTSRIILIIEFTLIVLKFVVPYLFNKIINHDGTNLLNLPKYLNIESSLGSFESLHGNTDKFNYNYALSAWIFLDNQPSSTAPSYVKYTNILDYGGKPQILYNNVKNTLIIKAKIGNISKIIYKTKMKHQKWTHVVINYQGGTLDIFMDNKLVSSTSNIVPFMTYDNITAGKTNGINGGICNVTYYNAVLPISKINWMYNLLKYKNPPVF